MKRQRLLGMAAAGVGATVAALATGLVVERRVVTSRKAGAADADRLGGLRSDPVTVVADDGLELYAEVDEVKPYRNGNAVPRAEHEPTLVFVHGYALNLDCWHFQRRHYRGKHRMVFYDQRSHGRSERSSRENATIDQLGDDLAAVIDDLVPEGPIVLIGHSMGGMTLMTFAEQQPEVFDDRVVAAALISTTAGGLHPHRMLSTLIPDRVGGTLGPG
ncbi:alpha/beta fold hydrolase [Nocardioides mesophilus]|uniref:alpha/beta fold hydrolase n=1 Tax=Nocardioides mesophilus TaxID=433659 RepID=UPI001FE627FB|nr:alpha/beta fold hydrolase [Nocardioides mesophilus]